MLSLSNTTKEQIMTNGFTPKKSKMYILIKDYVMRPDEVLFEVDVGHAVNGAAHAGAMITSHWPRHYAGGAEFDAPSVEDPVMADWYDNSFIKCSCKVTREEFEYAKEYFPNTEWFAVTESAFGGAEIILVFKPRTEWPPFFRSLKLYS